MTQLAYADPAPPTLPPGTESVAPPAGSTAKVFLVGHAKGVQIYTCNGTNWALPSVPRADLVDDAGNLIVKHAGTVGGPPTWTSTADNSAVKGVAKTPAPSPAPGPAIDWLRVTTQPLTSTPPAPPIPTGLLTDTQFIQRVNTQGGTPPPDAECKAQTANKVKEVPYKADYYFWK
jgi:hypothetical protein